MDRPRDEGFGEGRPVEPGEARAYGDDPEAVEFRRTGRHPEGLGPDIPASGPKTGERGRYDATVSRGSARTGSVASPATGVRRAGSGQDLGGGDELAPARRDSVRWGPIWA